MFPRSVRGVLGPDEAATMTTAVMAKAPIAVQNHHRSTMGRSGLAGVGAGDSTATAGGTAAGGGGVAEGVGVTALGSGSTGAGGAVGDSALGPVVWAWAGAAATTAITRPRIVTAVAPTPGRRPCPAQR